MRKFDTIVVHCSDSEWGDAAEIRRWHLERGFSDIGYHFVVLNGFREHADWVKKARDFKTDGLRELGRPLYLPGAHVAGHNATTVGVCLIGTTNFTGTQLQTLQRLVFDLRARYGDLEVKGHCEYDSAISQGKTCPNIEPEKLRELTAFKPLRRGDEMISPRISPVLPYRGKVT